MTTRLVEFFGQYVEAQPQGGWPRIIRRQQCPYLGRKCLKTRKSSPEISIGTCTVKYGEAEHGVITCPYRLLERRQVFNDCIQLLTLHEPGNELHVVAEVTIPSGNVDYFLVSARRRKVVDFVAIEWQTLDTTGTVWPERQRFIQMQGLRVKTSDVTSKKTYGLNWRMTAKTILVQLHHKVQTLEALNKHLVLVVQSDLLAYMQREFDLSSFTAPRIGDSMHIHAYGLVALENELHLDLRTRLSSDSHGVALAMGQKSIEKVELAAIVNTLESKLSDLTLLTFPMMEIALEAPKLSEQ